VKALTDPLTGLANARALRHQFEEAALQARRYGYDFSVLMMDLDGFKAINDTLGHQAGDQALRDVAQLLSRQIRSTDFLSRYAGDEFVALLQVHPDEVRELVHRLQMGIDKHDFGIREAGMVLGMSIGWACYGTDGDTLDELLIAADRAMYSDKFKRKSSPPESRYTDDSEPASYTVM
jgi:diguanylate cyclase (GGDEF)-like protein